MMKALRKFTFAVTVCLSLTGMVQAKEDVLQKFIDNYRVPFSAEVELGVWHGNLDKCKELADKHGIPMIAVWSNEGCAHCEILEKALMSDAFNNWAKKSGLLLCFTCSKDPKAKMRYNRPDGDNTTIGKTDGAYYWFCKRPNLLKNYPYVRFYWYENGKKKVDYSVHGDKIDGQQGISGGTYDKAGNNCISYIENKSGFKSYLDSPKTLASYFGGVFTLEESDGNRLEAEAGTTDVTFELARTGQAVEVATNNIVKLVAPDGTVKQTVTVVWKANQESQDVTVDVSKVTFTADGQKAYLIAADASGAEQATNTITFVDKANSVANPLWIGERSASGAAKAKPGLEFGEWTMDIDVAKQKVAAADGDAYTLVAIEGSLWCHDCANTERNFTGLNDGNGKNRLAEWAASNNVALVALDIPSFSTNSVACESPTLLSRKAYSTTLAYELPSVGFYDVSKGGAPSSLTNAMLRSGLGYLTRKGVSDAEALTVLSNNYNLVSTDLAKGGFHSPLDSRSYRTGVPIFVMLSKDGTVAARLTRFQNVSPMTADREKWDDMIKRFDEMLSIAKDGSEHDDGGVWENDYPSDEIAGYQANGGSVTGEISHVDIQDVFKLDGFTGNALLKTTVTGTNDAEVTVSYLSVGEDGKKVTVGKSQTGKLSEGIELEHTFTESGDYYVEVKGDIAGSDFNVANAKEGNFVPYGISGTVVYVPQEAKATGSAPADSDKIVMRLEEGQMYRIEGVNPDAVASVLEAKYEGAYCKFYTALTNGDVEVTAAYGKGGSVTYQKWIPGKVGFVSEGKTVTESVGEVKVALERKDGSSGEVTVRVSLDDAATTLYNSDEEARFEFEPVDIVWANGKSDKTNVVIKVKDDKRFDGKGDVALKLELVKDENGDTVLATTNYVLTVTEDDKQSAGKVAFTAVDPFFSKQQTVYAKESEGATVYAERIEASDGYVTAQVKASSKDVTLEIDGNATNVLVWANHKADPLPVKVTGLAAGKTATLTLEKPTDELKVLAASNKVTVVSVADDAPEFKDNAVAVTLYRYVTSSNVYPVVLAAGAEGAKLSFTKLSGTLPAGLKATYDASAAGLAIVGATTAKPGVYVVVYQVTQQVGSNKTPGLTMELTITVVDPTDAAAGAACNSAVAAQSSRTIKDIPVIDDDNDRLVGLLQVTVPKTGKISAKYVCSAGSISFSAKGWDAYDEKSTALSATLSTSKKGYSMELVAEDNGAIMARLIDPAIGDDVELVAFSSGNIWSKSNNASSWAGSYTVALVNGGVTEAEGHEGVAPRGNGYLTLKMEKTAVNSGTVKWAGMLPSGKTVSGSAILNLDKDCDGNAKLPIYKTSSTDVVALVIDMCNTTLEDADVKAYWRHKDKYEATSYDVELNIFGGLYSSTTNLAELCTADYGSTSLKLSFDIDGLLGSTASGVPQSVGDVDVTVGAKTITVAKSNVAQAKLSFDRNTGVVTGSFKIQCKPASGSNKTLTANYKGVVLLGWGPGCDCGDPVDNTLPFVVGGYYISDKESVDNGGKSVSVAVKRGGAVSIDKSAE